MFATYKRLLKYLWRYKLAFAVSIAGFFVFAASQPMLAKMMELIIEAIESNNADARWSLPLLAVGVFAVRGVGWFLGSYYNAYVGESVVRLLKNQVFSHLTILPAEFYGEHTQGQLLHRLNTGVGRVKNAVTSALKIIISDGLTVIALLVYAFYLDWRLSLVFLVVAPVLFFIVRNASKRFRNISRKSESALSRAMQVSKELISNYSIVRGFGAEQYERERYRRALDNAFRAEMKIRKIAAIVTPVSQLVIAMTVALIVFLLLQPETLATSTTGDLIGYLTAIALLPKPIRQLSNVNVVIQQGLVGAELVFQVLDSEAEKDKGRHSVDKVEGRLSFNNVTFGYPGADGYAVQNCSFEIAKGDTVALVGKSGSGKSTLASLIYRVYNLDKGDIQIDGIPISDYQLKNLRKHIAKVDQNIALFDDTIRNNIAYGEVGWSDNEIWDALSAAYASEFVKKLPDGLDTQVGENGIKFSGGQRQRLVIARAFLKDAPILIMDEATSALDNESEAMVKKAFYNVVNKRTTIIIAHRLSTVERADKIVVMDKGKIVEVGTYAELKAKKGHFSQLHHAEFI